MFNCLYCNNPINQFSLQFYFEKYRYELIETYKSKISLKMINEMKYDLNGLNGLNPLLSNGSRVIYFNQNPTKEELV